MLRAGHTYADIQEYTVSQFRVFCQSAIRAQTLDQAALIHNVGLGAQCSGKVIQDAIRKLIKSADG